MMSTDLQSALIRDGRGTIPLIPDLAAAEAAPLHFYDRSRVVADWRCARSRWWQYEYQVPGGAGRGIVPDTTSLELFTGASLHDALAEIARGHLLGHIDIDHIALTTAAQIRESLLAQSAGEMDADAHTFANEQAALSEGLLSGFVAHAWPRLCAEMDPVWIEEEMIFRHPDRDLAFMSRPDLVMRRRDDGTLWYIEYKSTSTKKQEWINSWQTAVQLHSTCRAVEQTKGEAVTGVIVVGLYKGYISYGRQNSPFCYAYTRGGTPPFTPDQVRYEYASGFRRTPTWDLPGGVRGWVAGMPENVLADQFPQSPPIFIKDSLVDRFFAQRAARESIIREAGDDILRGASWALDEVFPQSFDQCQPAWGRGCAYRRLCHGHVADPLQAGFVWRTPHHLPELEQLGMQLPEGL